MSEIYSSVVDIDLRELTDADLELVEAARQLIDRESDGTVHTVGAAVRASDGTVHCAVDLYHFSGGPCAELVALGTARSNGARSITTIVAVGSDNRGVVSPCGRDRQVLLDYHPGIRVMPTADGPRSASISDLIALSFVWEPEDEAD